MEILYKDHSEWQYLDVFVWRWFLVVLLSLFGLPLHLDLLEASFCL